MDWYGRKRKIVRAIAGPEPAASRMDIASRFRAGVIRIDAAN